MGQINLQQLSLSRGYNRVLVAYVASITGERKAAAGPDASERVYKGRVEKEHKAAQPARRPQAAREL